MVFRLLKSVSNSEVHSLEFLKQIAREYSTHEVTKGILINVSEKSRDTVLSAAPVLLHRVIVNMVKNALEETSQGKTVSLFLRKRMGSWISL